MRLFPALRTGVLIAAVGMCLQGQTTPSKELPSEGKGLPPRATPGDYQAHTAAGAVTVAAEFTGHAIPTAQGTLTTEDYVVVETGIFGKPDARMKLAAADFSLRINGKKTPQPSVPYGMVVGSVKDPEWEPPVPVESKSKTSLGSGGGRQGDSSGPPPPVVVPLPVQRAMAQRVQKAAFPEGDRALPEAGLLFFQYRGKTKGIHSLELIYEGPAGKAALTLQP
jgi:hypothetical protein